MRIYRDIIRSAWHILWRYAWLWPFGLLAAVSGNGGEFSAVISKVNTVAQEAGFLTGLRQAIISNEFEQALSGLGNSLSARPLATAGIFILFGVVALLVVWLIIVSQVALIQGTSSIQEGKPSSFLRVAETGNRHFWPILFLNILARFATYLMMAIALLPFLISFLAQPNASSSLNSLVVISFLIFVPIAIIVSFILKYAAISVVLEDSRWWVALERAVNLFFRNWLVSLEMAAVLFAANIVLSIAVFSLTANTLLALPFSYYMTNFSIVTVLRYLPAMLLIVAAGAWFSTFSYAAWTILFRKLQAGTITPKLLRLTTDVPEYMDRWMRPSISATKAKPVSRSRRSR